jgi:hypothetical protein
VRALDICVYGVVRGRCGYSIEMYIREHCMAIWTLGSVDRLLTMDPLFTLVYVSQVTVVIQVGGRVEEVLRSFIHKAMSHKNQAQPKTRCHRRRKQERL